MANVAQIGVGIRNDAGPGARAFQADAARVGRSARGAAGDVRNLQTKMTTLGRASSGAGSQILKAFGVIGGFMVVASATKAIAKFEETMALAGKVARATGDQFAKMEEQARTLGATTRFTASEAADGLLFLGRAGFSAEEAMAALPSTLNLAQAGVMGLGDAADMASNVVKQFGLSAEETVRVVDTLLIVSNRANTNVQQLGEAMKYAGPVAGAMGLTVEQTAAAMGALGDSGIQASLAGTNLRGVFAALLGPTSKAQGAFEDMGLSLKDLDIQSEGVLGVFEKLSAAGMTASQAVEIFGRRNAAAALVLADSTAKMSALEIATRTQKGEAQEMADVMDDTLAGSLRNLKSAFEGLMLAGGDAGFAGVLRAIVDTTTGVLRVFAGMQDSVEKNRGLVLALANVVEILVIRFVALKAIAIAGALRGIVVQLVAAGIAARATGASFAGMGAAVAASLGPITLLATGLAVVVSVFNTASRSGEEFIRIQQQIADSQEATNRSLEALARSTTFEQRIQAQSTVLAEFRNDLEKTFDQLQKSGGRSYSRGFAALFEGIEGTDILMLVSTAQDRLANAYDAMEGKTVNARRAAEQNTEAIIALEAGVKVATGDIISQIDALNSLAGPDIDWKDESHSIEARVAALQQEIAVRREQLIGLSDLKAAIDHIKGAVDPLNSKVWLKDSVALQTSLTRITKELDATGLSIDNLEAKSKDLSELTDDLERLSKVAGRQTSISDEMKLAHALESQLQAMEMTSEEKRVQSQLSKLLKDAGVEITTETENQVRLIRQEIALRLQSLDIATKREQLEANISQLLHSMRDQVEVNQALLAGEEKRAHVLKTINQAESQARRLQIDLTRDQIAEVETLAGLQFDTMQALQAMGQGVSSDPLQNVLQGSKEELRGYNEEIDRLRASLTMMSEGGSTESIKAVVQEMDNAAESALRLEQMQADMLSQTGRAELSPEQLTELQTMNSLMDAQIVKLQQLRIEEDLMASARDRFANSSSSLADQLDRINHTNLELEQSLSGVSAERSRDNDLQQASIALSSAMAMANEAEKASLQGLAVDLETAIEKREKLNSQAEGQKIAEQAINQFASSFSSMVTDVITGSQSAEEAIKGFILKIGEMVIQAMIAAVVTKTLKAAMGIPFADGGVIQNGRVQKFAYGGVVGGPTAFPMGNGDVGVMGEQGPEAIMPLKRGSDGRLGVEVANDQRSRGGGNRIFNVNMTVNTPDVNSFKKSRKMISDTMRKATAGL